jgi:heme-degrading monooxygenase HmoA
MPYTLVRVTFEDFARWKAVFDELGTIRRAYGSKGVRVFRNIDKPNEAVIIGEYEDAEKARQLLASQELREAMQRGGVSTPPDVTLLDEVDRLPA